MTDAGGEAQRDGAQGERNEFSRPVPLGEIGDREVVHEIEATAGECAAVARRFGLLALGDLRASLRLRRPHGGPLIRLAGRFEARVVQACVVTLEPVDGQLSEVVSLLYTVEQRNGAADQTEVEIDVLEDDEPPEPVGPHGIDLGEVVAQQLAMALDPYPRKPGVTLDQAWSGETGDSRREGNPFAVLKALKRNT